MNASDPPPETPEISLRKISREFLGAIQRHYDILALHLGALRQVNEENYEGMQQRLGMMPDASQRHNFEQAKEQAEAVQRRSAFAESLNILIGCLDQCFTLSVLASLTPEQRNEQAGHQRIEQARAEFSKLSFEDKVESLNQFFELDEALMRDMASFFQASRLLLSGQQHVTEQMASPEDGLFRLALLLPPRQDNEEDAAPTRVKRAFRTGEKLHLNKTDLLAVPVTVADYLWRLFEAMQAFGKQMETLEEQ